MLVRLGATASASQRGSGFEKVGVTGRYSNRQIAQLAENLLDWALEQGP